MKHKVILLAVIFIIITTAQATAQTEPKTAEEYVKRGNTYLEKKEYDKAIADFNAALCKNGKHGIL
ncbi:hypothetical protein R84B8_02934 [Treponema sp. R8-4-B8]